jgi:hypothetical protein
MQAVRSVVDIEECQQPQTQWPEGRGPEPFFNNLIDIGTLLKDQCVFPKQDCCDSLRVLEEFVNSDVRGHQRA